MDEHEGMMTYALDRMQNLVHIDEVENGIACGCMCPACGERLVAKNGGNIVRHHFAHESGSECRFGLQTALHLLAKDVIAEGCDIALPPIEFRFQDWEERLPITRHPRQAYTQFRYQERSLHIRKPILFRPDKVTVEKRLDNFIPDVIVEYKGHPLIIEIFVTHAVDDEKKEKIRKTGIAAIEVHLEDIEKQDFHVDRQFLKGILEETKMNFKGLGRTQWVYNPILEKMERDYWFNLSCRMLAQKLDMSPSRRGGYDGKYVSSPCGGIPTHHGVPSESECSNCPFIFRRAKIIWPSSWNVKDDDGYCLGKVPFDVSMTYLKQLGYTEDQTVVLDTVDVEYPS